MREKKKKRTRKEERSSFGTFMEGSWWRSWVDHAFPKGKGKNVYFGRQWQRGNQRTESGWKAFSIYVMEGKLREEMERGLSAA